MYRRSNQIKIMIGILLFAIISVGIYFFFKMKNEKKSYQNLPISKNETEILGFIEHGAAFPNISSEDVLMPFEYSGGEFKLEYYMNTKGNAQSIGFMIFINGKPIKSKIESLMDYNYCNYIEVSDEKEQYLFDLYFIPPNGLKGNTYDIDIISIYNPMFKPDMIESMGYNINHSALGSTYQLYYSENIVNEKEGKEMDRVDKISDSNIYKEGISEEFIKNNFEITDAENLREVVLKDIAHVVYFNDQKRFDNLKLEKDILHISYKIAGIPNLEYETTFFVNHEPIDGVTSFESKTEKGRVCVIDVYLDTSQISPESSFYLISIPKNRRNYLDMGIGVYKSPSILLYK